MTSYDVQFTDERGRQQLDCSDVVLQGTVYEFCRDNAIFLRVPAAAIASLQPPART